MQSVRVGMMVLALLGAVGEVYAQEHLVQVEYLEFNLLHFGPADEEAMKGLSLLDKLDYCHKNAILTRSMEAYALLRNGQSFQRKIQEEDGGATFNIELKLHEGPAVSHTKLSFRSLRSGLSTNVGDRPRKLVEGRNVWVWSGNKNTKNGQLIRRTNATISVTVFKARPPLEEN